MFQSKITDGLVFQEMSVENLYRAATLVVCLVFTVAVFAIFYFRGIKKGHYYIVYGFTSGFIVSIVDCFFEEIVIRLGWWQLIGGTFIFDYKVPIETFIQMMCYGAVISLIIDPRTNGILKSIILILLFSALNVFMEYLAFVYGLLVIAPYISFFHIYIIWIILNTMTIVIAHTLAPLKKYLDSYCIENMNKFCKPERS